MHFKEIKIKNWGPILKLNWEISNFNNKTLVLCGLPGTGKTSILRSMTYGLSKLFMGNPVFVYFVCDRDDYQIAFTLEPDTEEDLQFLNNENSFYYPSNQSQKLLSKEIFGDSVPFAAIFPDSFSNQYQLIHFAKINPSFRHKPDYLWLDPSKSHNNLDFRMIIANIVEYYFLNEKINEIDLIVGKVNRFLSEFLDIQISISNGYVSYSKKSNMELIPATFISASEEYIIGFLITIYTCLKKNSILLLDAPETHLPPVILTQLIKIVENEILYGQIIITSHSPSLLTFNKSRSIYILSPLKKNHKVRLLNSFQSFSLIKNLYGESVFNALTKYIPFNQSSRVLSYLLGYFFQSIVILRKEGDPQIQQLALWLTGFFSISQYSRIRLIDIGAGYGDLIDAIILSGCSEQLIYIPVEPNKRLHSRIISRCDNSNINREGPYKGLEDVNSSGNCIVFIINTLHELDLIERVELLYKTCEIIKNKGVLVIHEVAILPEGEADFYMWSNDDIIGILSSTKRKFTFKTCETSTRPGGWPLETLCIRLDGDSPTKNELLEAIISSLPIIKERWEDRIGSKYQVKDFLKDKYIAFLMAQVYNSNLWINKYVKKLYSELGPLYVEH